MRWGVCGVWFVSIILQFWIHVQYVVQHILQYFVQYITNKYFQYICRGLPNYTSLPQSTTVQRTRSNAKSWFAEKFPISCKILQYTYLQIILWAETTCCQCITFIALTILEISTNSFLLWSVSVVSHQTIAQ